MVVTEDGLALESPGELPAGAHAGPWVIEHELGRGGMATVYAAVHARIGKRAAIKVLHRDLVGPGAHPERMLLEARVVNEIGHPNIVDIFETGTLHDGRPYIVMERLDGEPLSVRAERPLGPDETIAILLQVCDALIAAHAAGVIHRDLKLDNIFLVHHPSDQRARRVKVLDWGIARMVHGDIQHTLEGQLVGSPPYLSPEQARGAHVTAQTDVYSLGVVAYELFLGQRPFDADSAAELMAMHIRTAPPPPHEHWPFIPRALDELLLAMLAKQPEVRPTMCQVARRLGNVRAELASRHRAFDAAIEQAPPVSTPGHPVDVRRGTPATHVARPPAEPR
ncbi:MAG: serine/threonine protein kinase, partial [Myxococcota bacterium]|nr:serine/threonine protein kinase [Myxococcota bacterium]